MNRQEKLFLDKKVMYFIPHEDDEINMGGGLIYWIGKYAKEIKVVYAMNGDYRINASTRMQEALHCLKSLGIDSQNVTFLGYPDKAVQGERYNPGNTATEACNARKYTYIPRDVRPGSEKDFVAKEATRENLVSDIIDQIDKFRPDILFCVDYDSHIDHRMLSLCFETAMGRVIKTIPEYHPIVYKQFAYPTNYKGPKDFYGRILPETRFTNEYRCSFALQNPYYEWDKRVRFALPPELRTRKLKKNVLYTALKKHKSQSIISRSDRIINNDAIAWQRRTDNLLLDEHVQIDVSSGSASCLNDFILFDCSSITEEIQELMAFDRGAWIPAEGDACPTISITLDRAQIIDSIVLYRACNRQNMISKITICYDGTHICSYENNTSNPVWMIDPDIETPKKNITITVPMEVGSDGGFSEIEVFAKGESAVILQYPLYNDNFTYEDETRVNGMYSYDGISGLSVGDNTAVRESYSFFLNGTNLINWIFLKCIRMKYAIKKQIRKRM